MWVAFLTGCWNQIAAVLITLTVLGRGFWLYWYGWLWYAALAVAGDARLWGLWHH